MIIRPMTLADLQIVLDIERRCFHDPWKDYQFIDELNNANAFVLLDGDQVIAYGDICLTFDSADITNLAVDPNWQGRGYGETMLRYLLNYASKKDIETVHLEVNVNNVAALQLYQKMGFKIVRTRKAYYSDGSDAFDMILQIGGNDAEDFSNRE